MGQTGYEAYRYSVILVHVFGIVGNALVIVSVARQKRLLKNNYYFLVLHLAICDLGALIWELLRGIDEQWLEPNEPNYSHSTVYCVISRLYYVCFCAGMGTMMVISVLRYRATVHPLKPTISRRNLIMVCSLVYIASSVIGFGLFLPDCFIETSVLYEKIWSGAALFLFIFPVIFIAVCYCKIGIALFKQNERMKRLGPAAVSGRHNRNRRIFFVCLSTVVCYAAGRLLFCVKFVWNLAGKYDLIMERYWVDYLARILNDAGTHSANPLIYGILDRRMFAYLKLCSRKKNWSVSDT